MKLFHIITEAIQILGNLHDTRQLKRREPFDLV